jgi:prepilin-type N-terminal cleavage/methylation domain-containing protein
MQLRFRPSRPAAFTLMEILVVIAIIVVVASIAYPVYRHFQLKSAKVAALSSLKTLAEGTLSYIGSNGGVLPNEDLDGKDNWTTVKTAAAEKTWYVAVPKHLGKKSVSDFSKEGRNAAFYTDENIFFLKGAQYPEKRTEKPLFAVAFNSKLSKATPDGAKLPVKVGDIIAPARTVMYFEQGLPGETRAHESISKKDYDGAPKGSAKSFVARYNGKIGLVALFDGRIEEVKATSMLTPIGSFVWSPESANDSTAYIWTTDPKIDPNEKKEKGEKEKGGDKEEKGEKHEKAK